MDCWTIGFTVGANGLKFCTNVPMSSRGMVRNALAFAAASEPEVLLTVAAQPVSSIAPTASPAAVMRADLRNRGCVMMVISFLSSSSKVKGGVRGLLFEVDFAVRPKSVLAADSRPIAGRQ